MNNHDINSEEYKLAQACFKHIANEVRRKQRLDKLAIIETLQTTEIPNQVREKKTSILYTVFCAINPKQFLP
jgi:hypothetical protein